MLSAGKSRSSVPVPGGGPALPQTRTRCLGPSVSFLVDCRSGGYGVSSSSLVPKGQLVGWTLVIASTYSCESHPQGHQLFGPHKRNKTDANSVACLEGPYSTVSGPPDTQIPATEWAKDRRKAELAKTSQNQDALNPASLGTMYMHIF